MLARVSGPRPEADVIDYVEEAFKGIPSGAIGFLETAALGGAAALPEEYETPVRESIQSIAAAAKKPFSADWGSEDLVTRALGEGLGSFGALAATSFIPGAAGAAIPAALAVGSGVGEASERAREAGASVEDRGTAALMGVIPGALELLPVGSLKFLNKLRPAEVVKARQRIQNAALEGGIEGAQEAATNIIQNAIAQGVYDPEQELIEGSGEAFGLGAGVGATAQALLDWALPGGKRRGATDATPPVVPPESEFDDTQDQGTPGSETIEQVAELPAELLAELLAQLQEEELGIASQAQAPELASEEYEAYLAAQAAAQPGRMKDAADKARISEVEALATKQAVARQAAADNAAKAKAEEEAAVRRTEDKALEARAAAEPVPLVPLAKGAPAVSEMEALVPERKPKSDPQQLGIPGVRQQIDKAAVAAQTKEDVEGKQVLDTTTLDALGVPADDVLRDTMVGRFATDRDVRAALGAYAANAPVESQLQVNKFLSGTPAAQGEMDLSTGPQPQTPQRKQPLDLLGNEIKPRAPVMARKTDVVEEAPVTAPQPITPVALDALSIPLNMPVRKRLLNSNEDLNSEFARKELAAWMASMQPRVDKNEAEGKGNTPNNLQIKQGVIEVGKFLRGQPIAQQDLLSPEGVKPVRSPLQPLGPEARGFSDSLNEPFVQESATIPPAPVTKSPLPAIPPATVTPAATKAIPATLPAATKAIPATVTPAATKAVYPCHLTSCNKSGYPATLPAATKASYGYPGCNKSTLPAATKAVTPATLPAATKRLIAEDPVKYARAADWAENIR
jgi:hypothetical protein